MKRGPKPAVMTVAEVARDMELDVRLVRARCRLSFFPGSKPHPSEPDEWLIPRKAVESALGIKVQPHFSVSTVAQMWDMCYSTLYRVTGVVAKLDDPLPPGKKIRAVLFFLGVGKPMVRIPESELLRLQGGAKAA